MDPTPRNKAGNLPKYKLLGGYAIIGSFWILTTSWLPHEQLLTPWLNQNNVLLLEHLFFILMTSGFLYWILSSDRRRIDELENERAKSVEATVNGWIELLEVRHK